MGITSDNVRNDAGNAWGIVAHDTPYDFLPYGEGKYMISYRRRGVIGNKVIVITENEFRQLYDEGKPLNDLVPWKFSGPGRYEMIVTNKPYYATNFRCSELIHFERHTNLAGKSFVIQWCKSGDNFNWLTDNGTLIYPTRREYYETIYPARLDLEWKIYCGKYDPEKVYHR